jgi:hypothetical protein
MKFGRAPATTTIFRRSRMKFLIGQGPTKIIFEPDHVGFPQIRATLYIDHHEGAGIGIFQPMDGPYWNESPLVRMVENHPVTFGHPRRPLHHNPMLTAVKMFLEAQAFPGKDLESLDLIPRSRL